MAQQRNIQGMRVNDFGAISVPTNTKVIIVKAKSDGHNLS